MRKNRIVVFFLFLITAALSATAIFIGYRINKEKEVTPEPEQAAGLCNLGEQASPEEKVIAADYQDFVMNGQGSKDTSGNYSETVKFTVSIPSGNTIKWEDAYLFWGTQAAPADGWPQDKFCPKDNVELTISGSTSKTETITGTRYYTVGADEDYEGDIAGGSDSYISNDNELDSFNTISSTGQLTITIKDTAVDLDNPWIGAGIVIPYQDEQTPENYKKIIIKPFGADAHANDTYNGKYENMKCEDLEVMTVDLSDIKLPSTIKVGFFLGETEYQWSGTAYPPGGTPRFYDYTECRPAYLLYNYTYVNDPNAVALNPTTNICNPSNSPSWGKNLKVPSGTDKALWDTRITGEDLSPLVVNEQTIHLTAVSKRTIKPATNEPEFPCMQDEVCKDNKQLCHAESFTFTAAVIAYPVQVEEQVCGDTCSGTETCDDGTVCHNGECCTQCTDGSYVCGDDNCTCPMEQNCGDTCSGTESCDDGTICHNGLCCTACTDGTWACTGECECAPQANCGDGICNAENNETCEFLSGIGKACLTSDDGRAPSGSTVTCRQTTCNYCGDKICDTGAGITPTEYCENNLACIGGATVSCRTDCTYCGNGVIETGEQCDYGASIDTCTFGDCSTTCTCPSPTGCNDSCTGNDNCESGLECDELSDTCRNPNCSDQTDCICDCNDSCTDNSDCTNGLICDTVSDMCRNPNCTDETSCVCSCNDTCDSNSDCPTGLICDSTSGMCRNPNCTTETDCLCYVPPTGTLSKGTRITLLSIFSILIGLIIYRLNLFQLNFIDKIFISFRKTISPKYTKRKFERDLS